MIPKPIPKFNKEQTRQLEHDLNRKATDEELDFWKTMIKESQKIKVF